MRETLATDPALFAAQIAALREQAETDPDVLPELAKTLQKLALVMSARGDATAAQAALERGHRGCPDAPRSILR